MLQLIVSEKKTYYTLLIWLIVGIISKWFALAFIPIHIFSLSKENDTPILFLIGLWFILTLSDSFQAPLDFAKTVKPVVIVTLGWIVYQKKLFEINIPFIKPFIIFFLVATFCITRSPYLSISIQKTLSYLLILFVSSGLTNYYINNDRDKFLTHITILGTGVLSIGIVLKYVYPPFVTFMEERYSGMFGNPNGLGMYSFLFLMVYTTIIHYHKNLFTQYQTYFIYSIIALSLLWAGSRGGIFASLLFIIGFKLFQVSRTMGLITMITLIIAYQLAVNNLEAIIISLQLQDYFRLETLETGSGRNIAFDFAWKHIQFNYYIGLGFGYAEQLMKENQDYFATLGHIGNVHNSYLTIWLDTGLIGLILFIFAWIKQFLIANKYSFLTGAVFFAVLFSTNVESWLAGSLNPFTIQLVMILTMLSNPKFYQNSDNNTYEQ